MAKFKNSGNMLSSKYICRSKQLKKLRDQLLKLTQSEFAELVNISKDTISRIELEKVKLSDQQIVDIIINLNPQEITERIEKIPKDKKDNALVKIVKKLTVDKDIFQVMEELKLNRSFFDKPQLPENYLGNLEQHSFKELQTYTEKYVKQIKEITRYFTHNKKVIVYSTVQRKFLEKDFVRLNFGKKDTPPLPEPIIFNILGYSSDDSQDEYWIDEFDHLNNQITECIEDINNATSTINVFALAPQPLVVELGRRLSNIPNVEINIPFRVNSSEVSWGWRDLFIKNTYDVKYLPFNQNTKKPAVVLNLSLSTYITKETIEETLKRDASIWEITLKKPDDDFLKSESQLIEFRDKFSKTLEEISIKHDNCKLIHVFLSVPIPIAFEIGRRWDPQTDPALRLYGLSNDSCEYYEIHTLSKS